MARYIDADALLNALKQERKNGNFVFTSKWIKEIMDNLPSSDAAPGAEVIEEYRKKVYAKMGKYTVMGREYIQRIMREVEKEMKGGAEK